ncbi:hypothetical protein PO124_09480 [Bacillus licheniformis]|nr:hypothetical protein [Bacillus licheniformis]
MENGALRYSLRAVKGVGIAAVKRSTEPEKKSRSQICLILCEDFCEKRKSETIEALILPEQWMNSVKPGYFARYCRCRAGACRIVCRRQ